MSTTGSFAPFLRAAGCVAAIVLGVSGVRAAAIAHRASVAAPTAEAASGSTTPTASPTAPASANADTTDEAVAQEIRIAVARAAMADGDAPGTDSKIAGRPANSTRLFEGPLDARGSIVRIYRTETAEGDVLAEVVRHAERSGYAKSGIDHEAGTASLRRGNAFVVARTTRRDHGTILSVVEFGFESVGGPAETQGERESAAE
ncbi:MAG: hypothetical protein JST00_42740 [Deltaproteobacteria bacterium]|nr:hypothetical protein [Deltaproteobacteria bacterium]